MSDINITIGDSGDINLTIDGISTFQAASDTPSSYSGQANKSLKVNAGEDAIEFTDYASAGWLTVVANDASDEDKAQARYICDGVADNVQIQAAIDVAKDYGGKVRLSGGTFHIADTIILHGTPDSGEGVHLAGSGMGATVLFAVAGTSTNVLEWSPTSDEFFVQISDFTVNGNRNNGCTGDCIYVTDNDGGEANDMQLHNLFVVNAGGRGINIESSWGFRIVNLISEFNNYEALFLNGSQAYVAYCFFAYSGIGTGGSYYNTEIKADNSTIIGNNFYDNGSNQRGLRLNGSEKSTYIGNVFSGFKALAPALVINDSCAGTVIASNVIHSNELGVRFESTTSGAIFSGNSLEGNTVDYDYEVGAIVSAFNNSSDKPLDDYKLETYKNTSGGQLVLGDVVIYKAAASGQEFTTTSTTGDDLVLGMVAETIENNANGKILTKGKATALKANGATAISIGDLLCTHTAAGICVKAGVGDMAFAIALEAHAVDSTVAIDAMLITPRKK